MSTTGRYPLPRGRELRATRSPSGLILVAIHLGDRCISGPLAMPEGELDQLRSALADIAGETGSSSATEE